MKHIIEAWNATIERGTLPIAELQIGPNDYIVVDFRLVDDGIEFSFDTAPVAPFKPLPVFFDGEIVKKSDVTFVLPFENALGGDCLDTMLQVIVCNVTEGFLIPNNLFYCEE